mgnify:CR=1 FL=1
MENKATTPNIQTIEDVRQEIEKVLWKHYDPDISMNMEEVCDDIEPLIHSLISHAQEKIEGEKRAGSDFARQTLLEAAALAEGYNSALDQANTILEALKTKV